MKERGFSLVELMVVVCIIAIFTGIATLRFSDYSRRAAKEKQIRQMQSELSRARVTALTERRGRRIKLYPTSFAVYSSTVDNEKGAAPVLDMQLQYRITWNNSGRNVDFDDRGLTSAGLRSICIEEATDPGIVDSIVVSKTRLNLGSRGEGGDCDRDDITVR